MKDTKNVVTALIQDDKEKFLLIKPSNYKDFGKYQNSWYPPTGHLKENETQEHGLIRELKEELNIKIQPLKLITEWEQDTPGETAFWWKCKIESGKIKDNYEIAEHKYFSKEEIKNLDLWPATRKFFEKYIWI
jgi:8-oxo-dGTP diphosphatase